MTPARAHSSCVMGCWPLAAAYSPPPCGEELEVGVRRRLAGVDGSDFPSRPPTPPSPTRGEGEVARIGFGVLGKFRAKCLPETLPLSTGLIGRPSYASTAPRSLTHCTRARFKPFSTSIAASASV